MNQKMKNFYHMHKLAAAGIAYRYKISLCRIDMDVDALCTVHSTAIMAISVQFKLIHTFQKFKYSSRINAIKVVGKNKLVFHTKRTFPS